MNHLIRENKWKNIYVEGFWVRLLCSTIQQLGHYNVIFQHNWNVFKKHLVKSSQVKFICIAHFMYKTIQSALQK